MAGGLAQRWRRAFLDEVDMRPLGLMRIGIGTIVTSMLVERIDEARAVYSDAGWIPHDVAIQLMDRWHWSLFHALGAPGQVTAVLVLGAIAAALFTVGLFTRATGVAAFVVLCSMHVRNPAVLYGGDLTGRILLFYLLLMPCGRAFSIDAARRHRRELVAALASGRPPARHARPVPGPVWPVRLLQIQICIIYLATGFSKLHGTDYADGSALSLALANPTFSRFAFAAPLYLAIAPALSLLTRITLYWEVAFAFMVPFRRLRPVALGIGLFVHGGIFALMTIEWWGPLMMIGYLSFVPGRALDRLWVRQLRSVRARRWPQRLRLEYVPSDGAVVRWVADIVRADAFRLVHAVPVEALAGGWRVLHADGTVADAQTLRRALPLWAFVIARARPR